MANGMTLSEAPATGLGKLLIESRFQVPNHQRNYSWTEDEVFRKKRLSHDYFD